MHKIDSVFLEDIIKKYPRSDEDVRAFKERMAKRQKEFKECMDKMVLSEKTLNRRYYMPPE